MLSRFNNGLERALLALGVACLVGFVGCVMLEVFSRTVFGQSFIWTLDAATILFLWSVFVVAPIAFRHDAHLQITLFVLKPEGTAGQIHRLALLAINLIFALAYSYLTWLTRPRPSVSAATGWPLEIGWASMLVLGLASLMFTVERFVRKTPIGTSAAPDTAIGRDLGRLG